MMLKLICVIYHDIPSTTILFAEHNTTKLMVGLLPLAPYHDSLQYIHHIHLMQTWSKLGCDIDISNLFLPSPSVFFFLSYALQLSVSVCVLNREASSLFIIIPDLSKPY